MKIGKKAALPGLVSEMVKSADQAGFDTIPDLMNWITVDGVFPAEWEFSATANSYKEK